MTITEIEATISKFWMALKNQVLLHSRPPALNIRIFYIIQGINNPFYAYLSPSSLYKIPIKCIENDRIQTNGFLFFLFSKLITNLTNLSSRDLNLQHYSPICNFWLDQPVGIIGVAYISDRTKLPENYTPSSGCQKYFHLRGLP